MTAAWRSLLALWPCCIWRPPPRPAAAAHPSSVRARVAARRVSNAAVGPTAPCGARSGAAVVFARGGLAGARGERWGDAAAVAAPRFAAFLDGERGDQEADDGVEPPAADERVAERSEQQRAGEICAEHVLAPLALGRRRAELLGVALLGDPKVGHHDHARGGERDPEPAHLWVLAGDERPDGLQAHVRGEQEELDRDQLSGARLGSLG